jgi:glycine/D-amino acid oxidase-like deaminating enzyme
VSDAIVIGGGVMGLGMARELRRRGLSVTLLERAQPGRAASWASAGIIGATVRVESDPSYHLRRVSEARWPAFAEELVADSGMDPEYRETGCLYLAFSERELAWLGSVAARAQSHRSAPRPTESETGTRTPARAEAGVAPESKSRTEGSGLSSEPSTRTDSAIPGDSSRPTASARLSEPADRTGPPTGAESSMLTGAANRIERATGAESSTGAEAATGTGPATQGTVQPRLLDQRALHDLEPALGSEVRGALQVAGGNVEPRRLCRALEIAARRAGVVINSGVEVSELVTSGDRVAGVRTADETFAADLVVLAAGAWSASIGGVQPVPRVRPQRGQIMALDQSSVGIRHVLMTPDDPYFVPRCDGRLVIGATREEAGWDPSLTVGGVAWLLQRAMQVVPALGSSAIAELWTGFRPLSEDGLPLIGPGALRGLFFLTGHGPSGISPLPGSLGLLGALIAGEPPPLPPEPFDPRRGASSQST